MNTIHPSPGMTLTPDTYNPYEDKHVMVVRISIYSTIEYVGEKLLVGVKFIYFNQQKTQYCLLFK